MPRIQNWVQYCDGVFFFFVMIFREPPQKHQTIYWLLCQNGPHKSNWRKTEPYQTCLFQISQIHKSLKLVGIRVLLLPTTCMYWCMFTYLDTVWNYKVTKINQLINQNRWTPSIRHQSGLNPLLVFSMPMHGRVSVIDFAPTKHAPTLSVETTRMDKLIFIIVIQSKTCFFQFWIRWVGFSHPYSQVFKEWY